MNAVDPTFAPPRPATGGGLLLAISAVLLLAGLGTLLTGIGAEPGAFPWPFFTANFVFLIGMTQFGVAFVAICRLCRAKWARPFYRLAETVTLSFMPFAFLGFLAIFAFGRDELFWWLGDTTGEHLSPWLSEDFLLWRTLGAQFVFYVVAFIYFVIDLIPDVTPEDTTQGSALRRGFMRWVSKRGEGRDLERVKAYGYLLAPVVLIVCAVANTFIAWDFGMTLVSHYHSSVYAGFYIHGNSLGGAAMLFLLSRLMLRIAGGQEHFGVFQLRNLGILFTGFALFWLYLFWAQYFVTWFGNLPHEFEPLWKQMYGHYAPYFWTMMMCNIGIPIGMLIWAATKRNWAPMTVLAAVLVLGIWLSRYLMVVPALLDEHTPFGSWQEWVLVAGLLGGFFMCLLLLMRSLPMISAWEIRDAQSDDPAY